MLDIKRIKEAPEAVKAGLRAKEVNCDEAVDRILELDAQRRALIVVQKQRRHRRSLFKAVPVVGWFGPIPQGCHKFGH